MYCINCGNKVDNNAYICVNCGVILKKDNLKVSKKKNSGLTCGIFSIIFGILAFILSFSLFFIDISSVGMYNEIIERIGYAIGFVLIPFVLMFLSLIFALIGKNKTKVSYIGLFLALASLFLIITEIMVVIIY